MLTGDFNVYVGMDSVTYRSVMDKSGNLDFVANGKCQSKVCCNAGLPIINTFKSIFTK